MSRSQGDEERIGADPLDESAGEPAEDDDDARHVTLTVRKALTLRRLDQYLPNRFPRFSRSAIQRLIDAGAVTVNGQASKASRRLGPGDVIDLLLPAPQPKEIPPEPIPIDVLWEDDCLLAINKQAGIIVHPARGNPHGTLVNGLVHYAGRLSRGGDPFRPGIIHRLDRDTTGIMLVAKTDEAHWRMSRQFEARRVHKEYLAVVHGRLDLDADRIDAAIARHPVFREKFAVVRDNPQARAAVTTWRVRTRYRGYTLVQLEPRTGRTHQLRVHMSHIRHPIVGDTEYGGRRVTRGELAEAPEPRAERIPNPDASGLGTQASGRLGQLERSPPRARGARQSPRTEDPDRPIEPPLIVRQALHAHRLAFRHPVTGRPMELTAPPPPDLEALIAALDEYRLS